MCAEKVGVQLAACLITEYARESCPSMMVLLVGATNRQEGCRKKDDGDGDGNGDGDAVPQPGNLHTGIATQHSPIHRFQPI